MTFGMTIKRLRIDKCLTQRELAESINIKSNSTICSWERDLKVPYYKNLSLLSRALDVSLPFLFESLEKTQSKEG